MQIATNDNSVTKKLDIITKRVVKYLYDNKLTVGTAESCTGGMLSQMITSVSGSSEIFELGVCSYANRIKEKVLGVPKELLDNYGAVSHQVADSMSENIRRLSGAVIGVGITGIAGPGGGTPTKPVGTVYVSVSSSDLNIVRNLELNKLDEELDREKIRKLTVIKAFEMIEELCSEMKAVVN